MKKKWERTARPLITGRGESSLLPVRYLFIGLSLLVLLAAAAIFLLRSNRPSFARLRGDRDYSFILVTVDTLRADRLGCYGFSRIETPVIDDFARGGIKFENCIAQTPLTLPSHTTFLTGTQPFFHGVRDNGGFVVPQEIKTLAEVFQDAAYATAAFVGAYVLDSKWGLAQGFDYYFDRFDLSRFEKVSLGTVQRPANEVMDEALNWLGKNKGAKFFAWIHLYDPHTPYDPPPAFAARYPKNPYLGEIAFADSELGRLRRWLEENGLVDHTFIVFASDHGESLGEHGEATHGFFVYQEALHVPLIFVIPFDEFHGRSCSGVVSLVDVMPTVLDMAGLAAPAEVQGRSLLPFFFKPSRDTGRFAYAETFYPRYHYGWSELESFQDNRFKLIIAPEPELYDLAADPGEARNLAAAEAKIRARLEAKAAKFIDDFSRNARRMDYQKIDEETREKLAALGYVGSFAGGEKPAEKTLANPKQKIAVFNDLSRAREMGMSGQADAAVEIIRSILADDPDVSDAYFTLGNIQFKRGDYRAAIVAFEQALERKPDDAFCVINIANSYVRLGRPDEAERFVIEYLRKGFSDSQLYYLLGTLAYVQKKYSEAIEYYERCLSTNSNSAASQNAIGAIYLLQGNLAKAQEHLDAALALNPELTNLHYNLAELFEEKGESAKAVEAYRIELEVSPNHFKASFNLARLYRSLGRVNDEEKYLELTRKINPDFPLSYFYLARIYLNRGENYEEAIRLAKKGIALKPDEADLPLGYFLLADLYSRLGDRDLAAEYARLGRKLSAAK
jgi:arylsulfatase A-like enzyme/predicted Zn-dependent protease